MPLKQQQVVEVKKQSLNAVSMVNLDCLLGIGSDEKETRTRAEAELA